MNAYSSCDEIGSDMDTTSQEIELDSNSEVCNEIVQDTDEHQKKPVSSPTSIQVTANATTVHTGPSSASSKSSHYSTSKIPKHKSISSREKQMKNKTKTDDEQQEAFAIMKTIFQNKMERDGFHIFGELVSNKLRNLKTEYARNTVEHMISNILFEANMGKYDYPPQYPQSRPQSSLSDFRSSVCTPITSPSLHGTESESTFPLSYQLPYQIPSLRNTINIEQNDNTVDGNVGSDILSQALQNLD